MSAFLKFVFTGKKRRLTWRKIAALLTHGITLREVLIMLRNRHMERKSPLAEIFSSILGEMDKGKFFDEALAPWVPHEEAMLIRGGVRSGRIPEALRDCADLIEARTKIIQGLIGAVIYPGFLMAVLVIFILVLALYVVPEMSAISDPASWTGSAGLLYAVTNFAASPLGLAVCIILALSAGATVAALPYWTGQYRLLVEKLPPWAVYRLVVGSIWLYTVATLLRGGIQMEVIWADMLKSGVMRPYLAERVKAIKDRSRYESNFGQMLLHLGMHFPDDDLIEEMAVYAALPHFHTALYDIAREWLDDGVRRINKISQMLNVGLMLTIISAVAWIAMAFQSLQQQLANSMGGF